MIPGVKGGTFKAAYQCVVAHLRAHPTLSNNRTVKTWYAWDGTKTAAPPADGPTVNLMPACEARLLGGPISRFTGARTRGGPGETVSDATFQVVFDLWTEGPNVGDLLDLGEAIFDALFPADRSERMALETKFAAVSISDHKFIRPVAPMAGEHYSPVAMHGQGILEITLKIRT